MFAYLPASLKITLYLLFFLLGAFLGSALNCLAYRMVRKEKWSEGRSRCPHCGHTLAPWDLIPVFSWLVLRGSCRYCKAPISPRYLFTELVLGLGFMGILWRFGLSLDTATRLVLLCCLLSLSLVDWEIQIIPHRFLLIPAVLRLGQLCWEGTLLSGVATAVGFGGGLLLLTLLMDKLLGKEAMGGGDIKLVAMLGLFFPLGECLFLLLCACILGIVTGAVLLRKQMDAPFPFGPCLSMATYLTMLFGSSFVTWYLGWF